MSYNPYQSPQASPHSHDSYSQSGGGISSGVLRELAGTKPWVRFMAVLGFIGSAFLLLGTLGGVAFAATAGGHGAELAGVGVMIFLIYGLMAAVYLVCSIKLWAYGSRIGELLMTQQPVALERALAEQRKFWKIVGILAIVSIAAVVLLMLVGVAAGSSMYRSSIYR